MLDEEIRGHSGYEADQDQLGRFHLEAGLGDESLQSRGPGPVEHEAVKPRDAAEHLVAGKLELEGNIAATFRFADRLHTAANYFLFRLRSSEDPDTEDDQGHDHESEGENQNCHSKSSKTIKR